MTNLQVLAAARWMGPNAFRTFPGRAVLDQQRSTKPMLSAETMASVCAGVGKFRPACAVSRAVRHTPNLLGLATHDATMIYPLPTLMAWIAITIILIPMNAMSIISTMTSKHPTCVVPVCQQHKPSTSFFKSQEENHLQECTKARKRKQNPSTSGDWR